jgi:SOS-response transcriptional repressor LexA
MNAELHNNAYGATVSLLRDHPEWHGVVAAALHEAKTIRGGQFAGAWVLEIAKRHGVLWVPNLRKLVAYGILEKVGESTRGGRRAYYSMPNANEVERALNDIGSVSHANPYSAHEITVEGIARRSTVSVPFYANLASCGAPNMSDAHVDDYKEVDARLTQSGYQYYLVRADGDSMNAVGINSGDTLLVRVQSHADVGQKVVACVDGGVTIKELQRTGEFTRLVPRSTNPEHRPIVMQGDAEIQGVVVATIPNFS